jgi:DmsE family decaheme c-type cytochrome
MRPQRTPRCRRPSGPTGPAIPRHAATTAPRRIASVLFTVLRIALVLAVLLTALFPPGEAGAVPPGSTITFDGGPMGPVTLTTAVHADEGLECPDCHTGIFQLSRTAHITLSDHGNGRYCTRCHDGEDAFAPPGNCDRCHGEAPEFKPEPGARPEDATCLRCHGGGPQAVALARTAHGVQADPRTPACTDCHGASEAHVDSQAVDKPDRLFGPADATPAAVRSRTCLTCHKGGKRMHWTGGAHEARDVACTSCHTVHAQHDPVRERATQAGVCFRCHTSQRSQVRRPSHHPIPEGKVVCADCHNPHGAIGPGQLARDSVNDTCYPCHMEKRGPFVRTHEPVQEDCTICHNPHGSVNANLLKVRPPWLCQRCHEPTSHRGAPASFTLTGSHANTLARGCPNCHTNIHGTNNPSDLSTERSLRR